jgi:outer membrane receptor protein involved in Fe transport
VPPHNFPGLHLHEDHVQPQVVAQYKIFDKDQVYAKYVKGYKAGGFDVNYEGLPTDISPEGAHFRPEQAQAYEVGFKGLTLDDRLSFSLALFHEEFTDLQANAFVGSSNVTLVTNVGKARSRGLETDFSFAPIAGLKFSASLALTDARYVDFPGGVCTRLQAAAQPLGCVQDLSGAPTPYSSKWSGTLGGDYQHHLGAFVMTAGAALIARSSYNTSTNNEPALEQSSYAQLDAHVDFKPSAGPWSVSIFGRNLTDRHPLLSGDAIPLSTGGLSAISLRGRQVGLRLGAQF